MTDAAVKSRVATALHEGAHLVAAGYCRAHVYRIELSPTGRPSRTGQLGSMHANIGLLDEEAFISFVGYAWEELHGDIAFAADDLHDGNQFADQAGLPSDNLLNEARKFVRCEDGILIRCAAAGILATMPKSGVLRGRELKKLVDWFLPVNPRHARQANRPSNTSTP